MEPDGEMQRAYGGPFPAGMAVDRKMSNLVGDDAIERLRRVLNEDRGSARTVRLTCSNECMSGLQCHGETLADLARELIDDSDRRERAKEAEQAARRAARGGKAAATGARRTRCDKGVLKGPRGPNALKGLGAHSIGQLSLQRFRHGIERQVSDATRAAVSAALGSGVAPWNAGMPRGAEDAGARADAAEAHW